MGGKFILVDTPPQQITISQQQTIITQDISNNEIEIPGNPNKFLNVTETFGEGPNKSYLVLNFKEHHTSFALRYNWKFNDNLTEPEPLELEL